MKLDHKNNKLGVKIVFVARCDIHLDIYPQVLSLKWSIFGLITVGSSKPCVHAMQLSLTDLPKVFMNQQDAASRHAELKSHWL